MTTKPLAEMSFSELQEQLHVATAQRFAAEYQERLSDYQAAVDAANARKRAVEQEIDARLAALDTRKQDAPT